MKRQFRSQQGPSSQARYPIYSEGRRAFLRQLGAVLAGGAATALLGCGSERAVGSDQPPDSPSGGDTSGVGPDVTPAPLDGGWSDTSGVPDMPVTVDGSPTPPDMPALPPDQGTWYSDGVPPPPDMQMVLDDGDPD